MSLHSEVARRVEAIRQERFSLFEEDTALRDEINTVAEGVIRNMLALNDALSRQREATNREGQTHSENEAGILRQVNALAEANMWMLVREHETRQSISEVMQ